MEAHDPIDADPLARIFEGLCRRLLRAAKDIPDPSKRAVAEALLTQARAAMYAAEASAAAHDALMAGLAFGNLFSAKQLQAVIQHRASAAGLKSGVRRRATRDRELARLGRIKNEKQCTWRVAGRILLQRSKTWKKLSETERTRRIDALLQRRKAAQKSR